MARRRGARASFAPLRDPAEAGNGVHIHVDLRDAAGRSMLYDARRPAALSQFGERPPHTPQRKEHRRLTTPNLTPRQRR